MPRVLYFNVCAMTNRIEVQARYLGTIEPHKDAAIQAAAGRHSEYSGCGFGERDLGWYCKSELEAQRIIRALKKIGVTAIIMAKS